MLRILLVLGLVLSLALNGALIWTLWRGQREYQTLAKRFVQVRGELQVAQAQAKQAEAVTTAAGSKPAAAPAAPAASQPAGATPALAPTVQAPKSSAGGPTVESIRIRYQPRLEAIQADCESQLNAMVDSAKTEYDRAKQGGGKVDVAALGAKYIAKATSLRRGCDKEVEAVLRDVGADLRAAGLPQDLVAEIQDTYEARIAERQAEIMAKAPAR